MHNIILSFFITFQVVVENINERKDQKLIRNICILADVDHGKTTLADHLIASNGGGVLHPKQAGELRLMDHLDEEERRAIAMKSSSIALKFKDYSINLIDDSPGHLDFCSEASTAARLSDGALVLVDVVEVVHIQTKFESGGWVEKLTPCLVLNKVDRLICELNLSLEDAYTKLLKIIHQVNRIVDTYMSEKYLSDVEKGNMEFVEYDDEDTFQPQKRNVIFACGLDGWGFRINDFAKSYAAHYVGSTVRTWQEALWGPRYFVPKRSGIEISNKHPGPSKDPMFVQFILEPLWQVYQTLGENGESGLLQKLGEHLNLSIPPHELQNKDPRAVLQSMMSRWLPLSDTVLSMVVECIPDPIASQSFRVSRLLPEREAAK